MLTKQAPAVPIIDLFARAPRFNPRATAYLLPAFCQGFADGAVILTVVDPGVGTDRHAVCVRADGLWYVGPDNGIFSQVVRRAGSVAAWRITWQPEGMSRSFHGRDLFAPVAAWLALGHVPGAEFAAEPLDASELDRRHWPVALAEIIYIDRYGNAMTGIPGERLDSRAIMEVSGRVLRHAETFGAVDEGAAFWYVNANGLVEIAVNKGHAARDLGLSVGSGLTLRPPSPA